MEEEEVEERATHSRRESALEAPDADSPTRVEEAEEVTQLEIPILSLAVLCIIQRK
jgi:hypothetical protein